MQPKSVDHHLRNTPPHFVRSPSDVAKCLILAEREGATGASAAVLPVWQLRGGSARFGDLAGPVVARSVLGVGVVVVVVALLACGHNGHCNV